MESLHEWAMSESLRTRVDVAAGAGVELVAPPGGRYVGRTAPFAVLCQPGLGISAIKWELVSVATPEKLLATVTGAFWQACWRPKAAGKYRVIATPMAGTTGLTALCFDCEVLELPEEWAAIAKMSADQRHVRVGNAAAFLRAAFDLWPVIDAAHEAWKEGDDLLRKVVTKEFLVAYCYKALEKWRAESMVRPPPAGSEFAAQKEQSPGEALAWNRREGCMGLMVSHAAIYADHLPAEACVGKKANAVKEALAGLSWDIRATLGNELRFPETSIQRALAAFSWCWRQWWDRARVQPRDVKGPEEHEPAQQQAILATLVEVGGPLYCKAGGGQLVPSAFGNSVVAVQSEPAFFLRFGPSNEAAMTAWSEWEAAKRQAVGEGAEGAARWRQFAEAFDGGKLNYAYLRPYYAKLLGKLDADKTVRTELEVDPAYWQPTGSEDRGIAGWLYDHLEACTLLGAPAMLQRALVARIQQAEKWLAAMHPEIPGIAGVPKTTYTVPGVQAVFCPRLVKKSGESANVLSNHGLGLAIDIDPACNPYVFAQHLRYLASLPLGVNAEVMNKSMWTFAESQQVRNAYFDLFSGHRDAVLAKIAQLDPPKPPSVTKVVNEAGQGRLLEILDALIEESRSAPGDDGKKLHELLVLGTDGKIARVQNPSLELFASFLLGGWMAIPKDVHQALTEAGLGWGGYYNNKRDYMHFEYPPEKGAPQEPC